jgi:hypothetical protein
MEQTRRAYLFHGNRAVTSIPNGEYDSRDGKLHVIARVDDIEHAAYPHFLIKWERPISLLQEENEYDHVYVRPVGMEYGMSRWIVTASVVGINRPQLSRVPDGHIRAILKYNGKYVSGLPPGDYNTDHGPITVANVEYDEHIDIENPPYFWVKTTSDATLKIFTIIK